MMMLGTRRKVSLESLILKVPDHILDQPCTDRDQNSRELLLLVSQQTNLHAPALGRWLFIPENEIQAIETDNRTLPASDRRYQILLSWVNANGSKATCRSLIKAIYSGGDVPTVENICNKVSPDTMRQCPEFHPIGNETPIEILHGFKTLPTSQTVYTPTSVTSPFSPIYSTHPRPIEEVNQSSHQETKTEGFQMEQTGSDQPAKMVLPNEMEKFSIQQSLEIMKSESPEKGLGSLYRPHSLSIPATTPNRHQFSQESKLGAVTSECSTTSSLTVFDTMPKCSHIMGRHLQQRMSETINNYEEKLRGAILSDFHLCDKLEALTTENYFQKEELNRRGAKMHQLIQDSHYIHSDNYKLKQELELHHELLNLVCGTLETWKEEVQENENLSPLREQLTTLLKTASSPATNKTIVAAKEELEKLKAEKQDLETKLDGFISLYAEKQTQLQAIMQENQKLQTATEDTQADVIKLRRRVEELMEEREHMMAKNKVLEEKVAVLKIKNSELTMKCNKLEQSQIKVYLSKPAQASLNAYGLLRSCSEGSYDVPSSPVLKSSMSQEGCKKNEGSYEMITALTQSETHQLAGEIEETDGYFCPSLKWIETATQMIEDWEEESSLLIHKTQNLKDKIKILKLNHKV